MSKKLDRSGRLLLVNRETGRLRIALIEDGLTREVFLERSEDRGVVGHIYKGKVVRVLPGIESAFVEIGLARAAFLHVSDVVDSPEGSQASKPSIKDVVRPGQELLVQVRKEAMGTKGARISTHLHLPGRCLVYRPGGDRVHVSRRIDEGAERDRLMGLAEDLLPEKGGLILRTATVGLERDELAADLAFLQVLWTDLEERARATQAPALLFEDLDLSLRSVRDLLRTPGDRVLVDDPDEAKRIQAFTERLMPDYAGCVELWEGEDPLFERFGLEWEIRRVVRRRVWLPSGGYVIFDPTEALTSIDVNSGRYVGDSSFEETATLINLEAVKEIAYQLRLRDIGGLIVIDFIDMAEQENRERITAALKEALAPDRARTHVLPVSPLGLVEMTRKRARDTIVQTLTEPCYYCDGRGSLLAAKVLADSAVSRLRQLIASGAEGVLVVEAHCRVIDSLKEHNHGAIATLEQDHGLKIELAVVDELHLEEIRIR